MCLSSTFSYKFIFGKPGRTQQLFPHFGKPYRYMQPKTLNNGHTMQIKPSNIRFKNSNSQPCIAAHLQGTHSQHTEANLAKEQQLPTHGKQLSIQQKIAKLYYNTQLSTRLKEIKEKRKNKGLRP
jgi:hypothetical protein